MEPRLSRNDSALGFLEPPHTHDPSSVERIATLPSSVLQKLPLGVQPTLSDLRESTSVTFASYVRLQALLQERFDRLLPSTDLDGTITFSESSFFNFTNAFEAERTYLLSDAFPDWRHKASLSQVALEPYVNLTFDRPTRSSKSPMSIAKWWDHLETTVASWYDYGKMVGIPEYEDTIDEYYAIQRQKQMLASDTDTDESPIQTPSENITPTGGKEQGLQQLSDIKARDFASALTTNDAMINARPDSRLPMRNTNGRSERTLGSEFPLRHEGKMRNERKDSGIELADSETSD